MFSKLRDYQKECIQKVMQAVREGTKRSLIVMASGLGKTVTAASLVKQLTSGKRASKVLYLCHQNDILAQARTTFEAALNGDSRLYGYFHGEAKHRNVRYLFASFQTMRSKLAEFRQNEFDYIIVDESHHSSADTYQPVVEYFKPKFLLGITATPNRTDMKNIRELFGEEVYSLPLERALAQGLLARVDYRLVTDEIVDLKKIENPYRLSVQELNKKIFVPKRDEEIAKILSNKIVDISDPKTMIFCSSIKHAELLHRCIPDSMPVHSKLPLSEQNSRIQAFRNGIINTIITIDKFNEGIDIPEVNVVVFLRSTSSYTIFHQQLGRGLRKISGKENVLVLDFIANCERIAMVNDLVIMMRQERVKIDGADASGGNIHDHLTVDIGDFNFTETAKDVLDILQRINGGYTREVLIAQLRDEARRLGRTPGIKDVKVASKEKRMASHETFSVIFGSYNKALEAAELELSQRHYSKEDLLRQLRDEAIRLKRSPSVDDINRASQNGRIACSSAFANAFGSHNKALEAAGLRLLRVYSYSNSVSVRDDLILQLQKEAERLKRTPGIKDINLASKDGRTVSASTFSNIFGSHNKALEAAGLKALNKQYSKDELTKQLQVLFNKLGRIPTQKDINLESRKGKCCSCSSFRTAFGGLNNALNVAGLK